VIKKDDNPPIIYEADLENTQKIVHKLLNI